MLSRWQRPWRLLRSLVSWPHESKWVNLGGGHHITKPGYDLALLEKTIHHLQDTYEVEVYLEPGEAIALNAGYLYTQVLDIIDNTMPILILMHRQPATCPMCWKCRDIRHCRGPLEPGEKQYGLPARRQNLSGW